MKHHHPPEAEFSDNWRTPRRTRSTGWRWAALGLLLLLLPAGNSLAAEMGTASGRLMLADGTFAADGVVLFFNQSAGPPPAPGRYWRLPDIGGRIGPDGRFFQQMPAGEYYFGVITVPDGSHQGPPNREDWLYLGRDNQGKPAIYTVPENDRLELGTITASDTVGSQAADDDVVILEGIISDADHTPVADAVVELYAEGNDTTPLFQSEKTSADGRYRLTVPPGSYEIKPFQVPASRNLADVRHPRQKKTQQGDSGRPPQLFTLPAGNPHKTLNITLPPTP